MKHEASCAGIVDRLAGYVAEDLEAHEVAEVERHLAVCEDCRGELAAEKTLRESLGTLPVVRCPDRVSETILAGVDASGDGNATARRRVVPFGWRRATVGLAAAAAVLALFLVGPLGDRTDHTELAANTWTEQELASARSDILATLALTAEIINRTERKTVDEVFGRHLPGAVSSSIKTLTAYLEGGQG